MLSTGQSLSMGATAINPTSTRQPYDNLSLSPNATGTAGPFVPLIEGSTLPPIETPSSGIANTLRAMDSAARKVVIGLHGQGASDYDVLRKGGTGDSYARGMTQVQETKRWAEAAGGVYRPIAVTAIHGEDDYWLGNYTQYEGWLSQWQSDYEADINAITGRSTRIPMFINQMNSLQSGEIGVAQYRAHKDYPGRVILVGPKYQYGYSWDSLHLNASDSRHVGEMLAKVIKRVVLDGQTWHPLMPTSVTRAGNVVTIAWNIPVGTLQIDTTTLAARPNFGFEFAQDGGSSPVTISTVRLVDGNTKVQLVLSGVPDGANQRVRYAWRCYRTLAWHEGCGNAADAGGVGGNLRDSDESVSPAPDSSGRPLRNWAVTFEEPVR